MGRPGRMNPFKGRKKELVEGIGVLTTPALPVEVAIVGKFGCISCGQSMMVDRQNNTVSCYNRDCEEFGRLLELPSISLKRRLDG